VKTCTKCGETKPLTEFYAAATTRDGLRGDCKACFKTRAAGWYQKNREHVINRVKKWQRENPDRVVATRQRRIRDPRRDREQHLQRRFGISLDDYAELFEAQGGGCAICGRPPADGKSLHVDHQHESGTVRGLLCFTCNGALGMLNEDEEVLARAFDYVSAHGFVPSRARELMDLARLRAASLVTAGVGKAGSRLPAQ
jgi:hypothetical protein